MIRISLDHHRDFRRVVGCEDVVAGSFRMVVANEVTLVLPCNLRIELLLAFDAPEKPWRGGDDRHSVVIETVCDV